MSIGRMIVVFVAIAGTGALLLASVWTQKGTFAFIVGLIGMLLMVAAIKWLERAVETRETERQSAERQEKTYGIPDVAPFREINRAPGTEAPGKSGANPAMRRKLAWRFGSAGVLGLLSFAIGYKAPPPYSAWLGTAGGALALWNLIMFVAVFEKNNDLRPARDFSHVWSSSAVFRRNNLLLGLLYFSIVFIGSVITPPPPHAAAYIIAMAAGFMAVLFIQIFYIQFALEKGVRDVSDGWSVGERQLERVMNVVILVLMMAGYVITQLLLPNFIQEIWLPTNHRPIKRNAICGSTSTGNASVSSRKRSSGKPFSPATPPPFWSAKASWALK